MLKRTLSILIIMTMFLSYFSHSAGHVYATPDDGTTENSPILPAISIEAQYDQSVSHTWTQPLTLALTVPVGSIFVAQDTMQIQFPSNVDMDSVRITPETQTADFDSITNDHTFSLISKSDLTLTEELCLTIEFHLQNVADTGEILTAFVSNGDASTAISIATPLTIISVDSPEPVGMTPYSIPPIVSTFSAFPYGNPLRQNEYRDRGFNNLIASPSNTHSIFRFDGTATPSHIYLAFIKTDAEVLQAPVLTVYSSHPIVDGSVMVTAQSATSTTELIDSNMYQVGSSNLVDGEYVTKITFNDFSSEYIEYFVNFSVGQSDLIVSDETHAAVSYQDSTPHSVARTPNATGRFLNNTAVLKVENEVVGSYADTTLQFDFRMIISYATTPYLLPIPFTKYTADGNSITSGTIMLDEHGFHEFELAHGEYIEFDINGLRDDSPTYYRVMPHPVATGYDAEEFIDSELADPPSKDDPRALPNNGTTYVLFRNTRLPSPPPTAMPLFDSPFATLSLLAAVLITCYTIYIYYKKKRTK